MEYEFSLYPADEDKIAYFISSGPPILRLDVARIEGNRLVCDYQDTFATADVSEIEDEFVLMLENANENCPNFLNLQIRNKDVVASDWKKVQPGYVRVDKNHSGKRYVVYSLWNTDNEMEHTYYGCVYNITLKNDNNFQSDSSLWMEKDGVCIVNDSGDGFFCADSIAELYGSGEPQPTQALKP